VNKRSVRPYVCTAFVFSLPKARSGQCHLCSWCSQLCNFVSGAHCNSAEMQPFVAKYHALWHFQIARLSVSEGHCLFDTILAYWLTTWSGFLLEKLTVIKLVNKFPTSYGTRRIVTVFTTARHWYLSWARWNQPSSHPISLRAIQILSSHLRLGLQNGLFSSVVLAKIVYHFSCPMHAKCPAHLITDMISLTVSAEAYRYLSLSLCLLPRSSSVWLVYRSHASRSVGRAWTGGGGLRGRGATNLGAYALLGYCFGSWGSGLTPCSHVVGYQRFREPWSLHLQGDQNLL